MKARFSANHNGNGNNAQLQFTYGGKTGNGATQNTNTRVTRNYFNSNQNNGDCCESVQCQQNQCCPEPKQENCCEAAQCCNEGNNNWVQPQEEPRQRYSTTFYTPQRNYGGFHSGIYHNQFQPRVSRVVAAPHGYSRRSARPSLTRSYSMRVAAPVRAQPAPKTQKQLHDARVQQLMQQIEAELNRIGVEDPTLLEDINKAVDENWEQHEEEKKQKEEENAELKGMSIQQMKDTTADLKQQIGAKTARIRQLKVNILFFFFEWEINFLFLNEAYFFLGGVQ